MPENTIRPCALRPREAAQYLGIAAQTLAKWRSNGGGPPYVKICGVILYLVEDLDRFLDERRRYSTSDRESAR